MNGNDVSNSVRTSVGIPYEDVNWYDIEGQPFGTASHFNAFILNDGNNIVDTEGPMAIGGSFYSPRGLGVAYRGEAGLAKIGISPFLTRFIVGGNAVIKGPLVVSGHVIGGGGFNVGKGSSYFIGKDGTTSFGKVIDFLYHQDRGSAYWKPSDKGLYYLVSSYDVPRYIPNGRIDANLSRFFLEARNSLFRQKGILERLPVNGVVRVTSNEWILQGNDPYQNVFVIDAGPIGLINKGIRAQVPEGSLVIVRIRTGKNAHLQYGVMGEQRRAQRTLYVFEDATNIFMEKSADIWGSILAPQAMFHGHPTGGHVSGNVAFGSFAVNENSGFEFHWHPFVGGIVTGEVVQPIPIPQPLPVPEIVPIPSVPEEQPVLEVPPVEEVLPLPEVQPCPVCPAPVPCPMPLPCPTPEPCPIAVPCPAPEPCPAAVPCPVQEPCPTPEPCPDCPTCPEPEVCPTCPAQESCPECPSCPEAQPCPDCPSCPPCHECPECPEQRSCPIYRERIVDTKLVLFPVPQQCPKCPESVIKPGKIIGCIWGCHCERQHEWEVKLYKSCNGRKILIACTKVAYRGCFEFNVPYEGCYLLSVCPISGRDFCRICRTCKPFLSLKNVGVSSFMVETNSNGIV